MANATNLSRAATVSAASASHRRIQPRRGSFTADRSDTKSLFNHSFDNKRVSRDDLALILKSSKSSTNVTAFHIPIHGRPPSPELSPRTSSQPRTTLVRTSTPDSMGDSGEVGVIAVGMAIGSPTQMGDFTPAPWNPRNRAMSAAVDTQEPEPQSTQEPVEEKPRKWGIFRSKSKRSTRPEKPQRSLTDSNASSVSLASSAIPSSVSEEPSSRRAPKHKPIVLRAHTEPRLTISEPLELAEDLPLSVQTPSEAITSPSKAGKEKVTTPIKASKETKPKEPGSGGMARKMTLRGLRGDSKKKRAERIPVPPSSPPPMPAIPRALLDVEIPSIKMDRYSVMFNSVLQPQQGSSSSLLARRQANLDNLKTVKDAIAENRGGYQRTRRATSPQPSPSFEPNADTSKPLPSPRFRANTNPVPYDSPSFVSTPEILTHEAKAQIVQLPPSSASPHDKFAQQATHYQPVLVSKFNRRPSGAAPERISLIPKIHPSPPRATMSPEKFSKQNSPYTPGSGALPASPEHTDDEKDIGVAKRRNHSPSHMASPPASVTSSKAETSRRFSPTSSIASPKKQASEADAQEALRNAVEVSIARQISVSQQQRKMLHPLKSNPSIRHRRNGSPGSSGPSYIAIEKDERLSETKSSTPVLVNPRELSYSPDAYQMNRKSEMVILEES